MSYAENSDKATEKEKFPAIQGACSLYGTLIDLHMKSLQIKID